jgi:hypothetical protein
LEAISRVDQAPIFSRTEAKSPDLLLHVDVQVSTLGEAGATGEMVDMKPFFFEYTLSTTTNLLTQ